MCCPRWWSRASPSSWWPNTATRLELRASLTKWKKRRTPRPLNPSDPMSLSKVLQFISTPLELQVLEWLHLSACFSFSCDSLAFFGLQGLCCLCLCCVSGLPKAAVVNQNRLLTALAVLSSNGVMASDVIYLNLPLYHTAGFIVGFIGCIETGEMMEM